MKLINYIYLAIATIIWAFAPALVKLSLNDIDPYYFLFIRFLIVSLLCLPYLILVILKKKFSSYDFKNIIIYSLSGQVSLLLYFKGLDLTTSTDTIILSLIGPLLTIAAGHYFFYEKLNFNKKVGITLSFIGALLVVIEPLISSTNGTAKDRLSGNLLVFCSTIIGTFWVVYSKFLFGKNSNKFISFSKRIGLKLHKKKYEDVDFNIFSFYIAFLFMLPFYVYNFNFYNELTLNLSSTSLGVILYMAVFSSIIAYILYIKAQKALEVTEVSLLAYISPIFSLPASFLILNEVPTLSAFMGLFIIFSGILIAEFSKNKAK